MKAKIIVLSGAGGVGKNTILNLLLARHIPHLVTMTKWTSRPPRPSDIPGEFDFLTKVDFEAKITRHELLEYVEFNGNYYGTPREPLKKALAQGDSPVLSLETRGARAIRAAYPDQSLLVFITAPLAEIKKRLEARGESDAYVARRLEIAKSEEIAEQDWYDLIVENPPDHPEVAVDAILAHLNQE